MGDVATLPQPERRTRRPPGMGPLWKLCPTCKGASPAPSIRAAEAPVCKRCAGKGMVLE